MPKAFRMLAQLTSMTRLYAASMPHGPHDVLLIRGLVVLSLMVCHRVEQRRFRQKEWALDPLFAALSYSCVRILCWYCRLVVRDQQQFMQSLVAMRRLVFKHAFGTNAPYTLGVPLVVMNVLWVDPKSTIVHTACPNFSFFYLLANEGVHFFVSSYWAKFEVDFLWHQVIAELTDPFNREQRVTWLGNTPDEVHAATAQGERSVLVNHNCFINESHFPLLGTGNHPRFDAVLNANASPWKRHDLTLDIETLAYITYSKTEEGKTFWPLSTKEPAYINETYLDEVGRQKIYADSCCGLVLSAREGANYTTGELLLSGIPIVSTRSTGGRSFWLTDVNSIVCGSTREDVAGAVAQWRRRCSEETVNRKRIRSDFLSRMHEQREAFVAELQEALKRSGATGSAEAIFSELTDRDELLHSVSFKKSETPSLHPYCGGKGWYSLLMLPGSVGNS